jgi:hypothetical protein
MRYILTLLAACAPLACLSAWSVVCLFRDRPASADVREIDCEEATKLTAEVNSLVQGDEAAARQWGQLDVFDSRSDKLAEANSPSAVHVVESWGQVAAANDLVAQVAKALDPPEPVANDSAKPRIQSQLDALQALIGQQRTSAPGTIAGSERFFQALDSRVDQLKQDARALEERRAIEKALQAATDLLKSAQKREEEEECLRMVNTDPLNSVADPELRAEVSRLRNEVQYRLSWRKLLEKKPRLVADRELLREYDDFLQRYPHAPTGQEKRAHEMLRQRRGKLHVEVALENLARVTELENLLAGAGKLLHDDNADQNAKTSVRTQVKNWLLATGLPENGSPDCLLGREEAVTKNGKRLIGYFYLPEGPKSIVQWRYWISRENREANPRGDRQIPQEDFAESPAEPKLLRLARKYDELRHKLIRAIGSKEEWQSGCIELQRMQKDLSDYHSRWGYDEEVDKACRAWTFEPQIQTLRQLVDNWDQFRAIFED